MDNHPLTPQLSSNKRYSSEAIQDILQRAMTHQSNDGFTPIQLQEMATELNIEPAVLQQAAIEWQFQQWQPDTIEKAPAKSKSKSKMLKLSAFFAAALLSAVAIPTTISAIAYERQQVQQQEDALEAFLSSDIYTYDDAVALAKLWNSSVDDSKARMGSKIFAWGIEDVEVLNDELDIARKAQTNSGNSSPQIEQSTQSHYDETTQTEQAAFSSSGYTADDAAALASFWGQPLDGSRAAISREILSGSQSVAI